MSPPPPPSKRALTRKIMTASDAVFSWSRGAAALPDNRARTQRAQVTLVLLLRNYHQTNLKYGDSVVRRSKLVLCLANALRPSSCDLGKMRGWRHRNVVEPKEMLLFSLTVTSRSCQNNYRLEEPKAASQTKICPCQACPPRQHYAWGCVCLRKRVEGGCNICVQTKIWIWRNSDNFSTMCSSDTAWKVKSSSEDLHYERRSNYIISIQGFRWSIEWRYFH